MRILISRYAVVFAAVVLAGGCGGQTPDPPPAATPPPPAAAADDADPADDAVPAPNVRTAEVLAKLMPSNGTGCAPGARCIRVTQVGKPSSSGGSIAQCRGEFADFIVPRATIPAAYAGPWFQPNLIENAHTGVPSGTRPWRNFDPRNVSQRLAYLLALRNYAFASEPVRSMTPQLTADSDYFDATGGTVPANQRSQKWYPAPRMIFGSPSTSGVREAARGMTLERPVDVGELGGNTAVFRNYAVAYYDARGARTFARVWSTATPGIDTPDRSRMRFTAGGLVYKLLYSAARPTDFPQDLLAGSHTVQILPNSSGAPLTVRLLQIDIAVKDERAGPTGWYFATYAFDRTVAGNSPWRKMVPVGLMWGNDPGGLPLAESWINPGGAGVREGAPRRGRSPEWPRGQRRFSVYELPLDGAVTVPRQHGASGRRRVRLDARELVPQPFRHTGLRPIRPRRRAVPDRAQRPHADSRRLFAAIGIDGHTRDLDHPGKLQPVHLGRRESAVGRADASVRTCGHGTWTEAAASVPGYTGSGEERLTGAPWRRR